MRDLLTGFVAVLALVLAGAPSGADDSDAKKSEKKGPLGQPAYEFTLDAVDGSTVKLANLKGKVVLLDVFETWCPHCNAAMPSIVEMHAKYKDKGLAVLGIDRAKGDDTPELVKKFAARQKIEFPVILLTGDMKETIWTKYDIAVGIPRFLVIDRKGVVRHNQAGANRELLEGTIKKLLSEKP